MRKFLIKILILIVIIGCSPKIKSITEYATKDDNLSKIRIAEFDKKGNKVLERNFGNQRSNRIVRIEYKDGRKIKETECDYFEKQDTCVVRQFSIFALNRKENLNIQTMYEADSAVRFVRRHHKIGKIEVIKTRTWEMFPTKDPDPENAMKLIDSVFYDSKGREVQRLHYNESFKEPWVEKYRYSKDGYTKEISGTRMDTIVFTNIQNLINWLINRKLILDLEIQRNINTRSITTNPV